MSLVNIQERPKSSVRQRVVKLLSLRFRKYVDPASTQIIKEKH